MRTYWSCVCIVILLVSACSMSPESYPYPDMENAPFITIDDAAEQTSRNNQTVSIIAIDALTWDILNPMIARGELPNFARLVQTGNHGILDPVDPMLYSPRIWTTVATGKIPEKHGITFFLINPHQAMQSGKTAGSDLRNCLAIWNILSHFKKRVHISNWMVSWPAEPVFGTVISDYAEMDHGVWPKQLQDRIRNDFHNETKSSLLTERIHQRFFPWTGNGTVQLSLSETIKMQNLVRIIYRDEFTWEKTLEMLGRETPDLSMLYLRSIDIASHFYWKYSQLETNDPRLEGLDNDIRLFGHIVPEVYRWADEKLGEILHVMPENTTFIILSDHGFTTHFDNLRGYNLLAMLRDLNAAHFMEGDQLVSVVTDTSDPIDAVRKIYVLEDVFPRYVKATGKTREHLMQDLTAAVLSLETTDRTKVLLSEPFENLKLMQGENKPDAVFRFNDLELSPDDFLVMNGESVSIETYIQFLDQSGNHHSEAIIIVSGKHARPGAYPGKATTLDIVPTILTLFDLPIAEDMDGKPLFAAFEPDTWQQHSPTRIDTYETRIDRHVMEISEPERPNIIQQLQAIGYIQ